MLDTLLEQERAVSTKASDRDLIQSSDMVCKMTYIRDVLKPLAIATERLCVEKYPSLSLVQPVLTALLKKHLVTTDTDPDITVQLTI